MHNPLNLPVWAAGLASLTIVEENGNFFADAPFGRVQVRFVDTNTFGVLDHEVITDNGTVFYNPLRVVPHPLGAEIIFTIRQLEMIDEQFDSDCQAVAQDLDRLARLLEK